VRLNQDIHGSTFTCFAGNVVVSIAERPILADPNKNTSTHVFSNIFDNSALISHLSRHVSQQVGE